MKKTLLSILGLVLLSSCSITKEPALPPKVKPQVPDTVIIYKQTPQKTNPSDTIVGYNAYLRSKELEQMAEEEFYSGNEKKADSLYRLSLKMLSQSNLKAEDFNFLSLEDQLARLEAYKELREKERNGITVTEEEINEILKGEKFPIGKKFAEKVAYEKKRLETVHNKWFKETLKRMEPYHNFLDSILEVKDLDPFIKWMYPVESAMKTNIRSRANAVGVAQFMSWTAKSYGLKVYGKWCDERLDPVKSLDASTNYMQLLTEWFNDPALAIAAYNAGQGRINSLTNKMNSSSYSELVEKGILPRETENHLPKIYAFMELANETESENSKQNKILENILTNNFDTISIKKQTDLDVISKVLGISTKILKEYNPSFQMFSTPPKYMVDGNYEFTMRIPKGIKNNFYEKLAKENPLPKPKIVYYRVKSGDNLSTIGAKYGVSYKKIMRANNLTNTKIRAGQKLVIPSY